VLAIKCVPIDKPSPEELRQMYKEIEVLKKCRHPHIVAYFGSCIRTNDLWVRAASAVSYPRACERRHDH
jgi:serine/threonine protein kinase